MNKEKVASVAMPKDRPPYQQWIEEFKFGSQYVKKPKLFEGNYFNTEVFKSRKTSRLFSGIVKFLNKIG